MPPVPPQDEQGLMQLVFSSITKRLRSTLLRRRKPLFGVPLPTDPSLVADPVPSAQLPLHFDSEEVTTTLSGAPADAAARARAKLAPRIFEAYRREFSRSEPCSAELRSPPTPL